MSYKFRTYIRESSLKTPLLARLIAKFIDTFVVLLMGVFFYPLGIIFAVVYWCWSDSIGGGQSWGKHIMGMKVISLEDGSPCSLKQSVIRNLPLSLPTLLCIIPIWGVFLGIVVGLPLNIIELYFLFKLDSGHRMGDVMADTTVMANDGNRISTQDIHQSWFSKKGMT